MSWEVVRNELLLTVVRSMGDKKIGERWIDLLGQTLDGQRLGACIVIDVRSGALSSIVFASILDSLDFSQEDAQNNACWAFQNAVESHPGNQSQPEKGHFACGSSFSVQISTSDVYVRILDLGDFITYLLDTNDRPMSALSEDDRARARRMYFSREYEPWEEIERMWTGSMGRAFITSLEDLNSLIEDQVDPGYIVNDALGLGYSGKLEFVAVKYPDDLKMTCYQPTTLDTVWSNHNWYVSYGSNNCWGLTHRCSGNGQQARERVHRTLESVYEGFSGKYIGKPRATLVEDREKLLRDAFDRM